MAADLTHRTPEMAKIVAYEFTMFQHLCRRLKLPFEESGGFIPGAIELVGTGHSAEDERDLSAQLESLLLHTRVLREFFYYYEFKPKLKPKGERQKPDDVLAEDFISDWDTHCPPMGTYLHDQRERLDKALAHLSALRVGYNAADKRWNVAAIRDELQPIIEHFRAKLPSDQAAWFRPKEDDY